MKKILIYMTVILSAACTKPTGIVGMMEPEKIQQKDIAIVFDPAKKLDQNAAEVLDLGTVSNSQIVRTVNLSNTTSSNINLNFSDLQAKMAATTRFSLNFATSIACGATLKINKSCSFEITLKNVANESYDAIATNIIDPASRGTNPEFGSMVFSGVRANDVSSAVPLIGILRIDRLADSYQVPAGGSVKKRFYIGNIGTKVISTPTINAPVNSSLTLNSCATLPSLKVNGTCFFELTYNSDLTPANASHNDQITFTSNDPALNVVGLKIDLAITNQAAVVPVISANFNQVGAINDLLLQSIGTRLYVNNTGSTGLVTSTISIPDKFSVIGTSCPIVLKVGKTCFYDLGINLLTTSNFIAVRENVTIGSSSFTIKAGNQTQSNTSLCSNGFEFSNNQCLVIDKSYLMVMTNGYSNKINRLFRYESTTKNFTQVDSMPLDVNPSITNIVLVGKKAYYLAHTDDVLGIDPYDMVTPILDDSNSNMELRSYDFVTNVESLVTKIVVNDTIADPMVSYPLNNRATMLLVNNGILYFKVIRPYDHTIGSGYDYNIFKFNPATDTTPVALEINADELSTGLPINPHEWIAGSNGKIYMAGRPDALNGRPAFLEYTPASNTIRIFSPEVIPLPPAGNSNVLAEVGGKFLFMGIAISGPAMNTGMELFEFDPGTELISQVADINPGPGSGLSPLQTFIVAGNELYFKGMPTGSMATTSLCKYNAVTKVLTKDLVLLPNFMDGIVNALINNRIYMPYTTVGHGTEVAYFDIATQKMVSIQDISVPVENNSVILQNMKAFDNQVFLPMLATPPWRFNTINMNGVTSNVAGLPYTNFDITQIMSNVVFITN